MIPGPEQEIDAYLRNKMLAAPRQEFERKLASDEQLRAETQLQRCAMLAIEKHGDAELRERIHHWENPVGPSLLKKYGWRIAIPLVALIGIIFFYNDFVKDYHHEELFDEYFEEASLRTTSEYPPSTYPNWNQGVKAYQNKDYELATSYFEEHLRRHQETSEALFYTGMAFLSQSPPNLKKATYYLSQVNGSPGPYTGRAKWNLALAYLKEGRVVRAKTILRELLQKGNYRREDVKELLETLSFTPGY